MLNRLLVPHTARWLAALWTVLILLLCFIPGREIPNVRLPLADKWVHFILFGVWSFLALASFPRQKTWLYLLAFLAALLFGWLVEELQGYLSFLGRSKDVLDILADSIGGALGVLAFLIYQKIKKTP